MPSRVTPLAITYFKKEIDPLVALPVLLHNNTYDVLGPDNATPYW